ncbi:hypothetical protein [Sulfitobacter sp. R18_1]|uniref:hypothetical protein n=1 Tax=Sulfitobacter sp. R18_1 TaxID=2821104 RepID=UPI001ADBA6EA|nr:hypothetical protein [Sulfitobacter sp. R18_1]MBO9428769.1 hypothetical protein [Sulfitobacter sp. R18_1]
MTLTFMTPVVELGIIIFNEGDEIGDDTILVAADTEHQARKVCDRYLDDICHLWDDRLHHKACHIEFSLVEDAEPDAKFWCLESSSGDDDPKNMKLVSKTFSECISTAGMTP